MKHLVKAVLLCIICIHSYAQETFNGKVISIIDGNTMEVIDNYKDTIIVKLKGIDSPEINQAFGEQAKAFTTAKCFGKTCDVKLLGKDRFGNDMATVVLDSGQELGLALLKSGLAWYHDKGNPNSVFEKIQHDSKVDKIGLWQSENPLEPWIFRRQQTMTKPKLSY